MGEALVLHKTVVAGRLNRLLVQPHCIGVSPFEAGDLGQHQCVLVAESRWIGFGPLAQLLLVRRQEFAPRLLLVGRRVLIACRHRQRGIIKVVEQLDLGGCGRKERLHLVGCRESLGVIA